MLIPQWIFKTGYAAIFTKHRREGGKRQKKMHARKTNCDRISIRYRNILKQRISMSTRHPRRNFPCWPFKRSRIRKVPQPKQQISCVQCLRGLGPCWGGNATHAKTCPPDFPSLGRCSVPGNRYGSACRNSGLASRLELGQRTPVRRIRPDWLLP